MKRKPDYDDDRAYDEWADRIVCSKDFETCPKRNEEGDCLFFGNDDDKLRRCWHVHKCPLGKSRG